MFLVAYIRGLKFCCGFGVFVVLWFVCFFSLWGWGALKFPHPVFLLGAVWFFGLGCFPVCVGLGRVRFCLVSIHGAMLGWAGWDEDGQAC